MPSSEGIIFPPNKLRTVKMSKDNTVSPYRVSGTGSLLLSRLFKCNEPIPAKEWDKLPKKAQDNLIKNKQVVALSKSGAAIRGAVRDLTLPPVATQEGSSGKEGKDVSASDEDKVDASGQPGADTDPEDEKFQKAGNNVSPFNIDPVSFKNMKINKIRAMLHEICVEFGKDDILEVIEDMDRDTLIGTLTEDYEPVTEG